MGNITYLSKFNFKVGGYSDVPSAGGCALRGFGDRGKAIAIMGFAIYKNCNYGLPNCQNIAIVALGGFLTNWGRFTLFSPIF